jgi:hypothetical protein
MRAGFPITLFIQLNVSGIAFMKPEIVYIN